MQKADSKTLSHHERECEWKKTKVSRSRQPREIYLHCRKSPPRYIVQSKRIMQCGSRHLSYTERYNKFKASVMRNVTATLRNMTQPMPPRSARICSSISDQYATDRQTAVQSLIDIDQQRQWNVALNLFALKRITKLINGIIMLVGATFKNAVRISFNTCA